MIPHYTRPEARLAATFRGGSVWPGNAADIRRRDFFASGLAKKNLSDIDVGRFDYLTRATMVLGRLR